MKLKKIRLQHFKRFADLTIQDLPPAKLVVLAGPNGCGKSSLFDSFNVWQQAHAGLGFGWDAAYHLRPQQSLNWNDAVSLEFNQPTPTDRAILRKLFYFRTAYRNDPDFMFQDLARVGNATEEQRFTRMIDTDAAVGANYRRLVSQAFSDVFVRESGTTTIAEFREKVLGEVRDAVRRLFPDLILNDLGDPLVTGTFRFDKGQAKGFLYKNLSGGEKSAFDLIADLVVKRREYDDTIFCIDEPEAHMNTRLQGALLQELYALVPDGSQLWLATHSIGMMRKAREIAAMNSNDVIFLDFGGHDFDQPVTITPSKPTRAFWESVLSVALDDLASLVAPREVVICEGNPAGAVPSKNAEHDARCYETIFGDSFPDVKFLSGGSSKEVAGDRLAFAAALPKIASGIAVRRVVDRDDHAPGDVTTYNSQGIRVLSRRHIESYLYDDEVLQALCEEVGKSHLLPDVLTEKQKAITDSIGRSNPPDDVKSAASVIYTKTKQVLGLTGVGNDQMSFARNTLAPLIRPGMVVYEELTSDIFGR